MLLKDSYIYMPNVKRFAVCDNCIIVFSTVGPTSEVDAEFVCRKISDNQYECISFYEKSESKSLVSIISATMGYLIFFIAILEAMLITIIGHIFEDESFHLFTIKLCGGSGIILLGLICIKLFSRTRGFIKFLFVPFGALMIFVGLMKIIKQ
ncbi:hypothetical protein SAMN02910298_01949 [Pseudobutyrivibrio sp. YE44]|nr:hypothetical protein SAMN02910298_01949 [Pseudobutyrivibrio sp. YE44]